MRSETQAVDRTRRRRRTMRFLAALVACAGLSVAFAGTASAVQYGLQVTVQGQGTVLSLPVAINCNASNSPCAANFESGSSVSLTATPAVG